MTSPQERGKWATYTCKHSLIFYVGVVHNHSFTTWGCNIILFNSLLYEIVFVWNQCPNLKTCSSTCWYPKWQHYTCKHSLIFDVGFVLQCWAHRSYKLSKRSKAMSDLWFSEWKKMSVERWANCQKRVRTSLKAITQCKWACILSSSLFERCNQVLGGQYIVKNTCGLGKSAAWKMA